MARGSAAKRRVTPQPGRPDGRPRRPVFACAPPSAQAPSRSAWPSPTRPHARGPPSRAHASPEWAARSRPPRSIAPISRPPSEQPGLGGRPTARRDHNRARPGPPAEAGRWSAGRQALPAIPDAGRTDPCDTLDRDRDEVIARSLPMRPSSGDAASTAWICWVRPPARSARLVAADAGQGGGRRESGVQVWQHDPAHPAPTQADRGFGRAGILNGTLRAIAGPRSKATQGRSWSGHGEGKSGGGGSTLAPAPTRPS